MSTLTTDASVIGVSGNIVSIAANGGPIVKNEVAYIHVGDRRLKAEILRVFGQEADLQVFEDTEGVRVGDAVDLTHQMLSVSLGPGLLGTVFDGLQNPLYKLAEQDGFFLQRGRSVPALDTEPRWTFQAACKVGDKLNAGDVLGAVQERRIRHKIMVPFGLPRELEVTWIEGGEFTVRDTVAVARDSNGIEHRLTLSQTWPVRRPLPAALLRRRLAERQFPDEPLVTTLRLIDTFFPIARGGTACIPGPFGAGKTVLQGLIARYSAVDVVIVVACGERAGEVLETITEFSHMDDPRTGSKLIDRTIIICNTSSMPVAAREASIFTGITLGEYYRQMGLDVLLIADSTSRWAQAMRETSGRLEEIPGEEAYPAYLDSAIKGVYERAGLIRTGDGSVGSLTMVGTVSPAGGNFEEPVTQATLSAVKCFLGLSYDRAYKRFYPAIDPLISWSRYLQQLGPRLDERLDPHWTETVHRMSQLLQSGSAIYQMMQVTGEEGVSLDDFVTWQKATFLDMVYLQQDAFDPVDVSVSIERQKESFLLLRRLLERPYRFADKDEARSFFTTLTSQYKNLNYAPFGSEEYQKHLEQIETLERSGIAGELPRRSAKG
ncbi:V-type ATP synthase subunit A [Candidatus Laterigemmans baculatus]|uniref:V-type ATP synthase subunit A n=1 Tax=Candidatus Laterigemmans baculatus TaxID=2770505 RepID=UPI0013D98CB2|nr:V-type ATP synthase subunit A [Candidatus Laterigemmans baculatus]